MAAALSDGRSLPARGTVFNWLRSQRESGVLRPVKAERIEFRFHAIPIQFLDERADALEDRLDLDVVYARATPEKTLLDWIYFGASPRTKLSGPPLDIELDKLNMPRLRRLAKAMGFGTALAGYLSRKSNYDNDPDVQANASTRG